MIINIYGDLLVQKVFLFLVKMFFLVLRVV